jgi:ubiquinone biosynthesis protein
LTKIKDNLPFWSEKLPEIPDLIYDYLKIGKENQQQQTLLMQKLLIQQNQQSKQVVVSILVVGALIALAIVLV